MARCTSALFTPCTPEPAAAVVLASGTTRLTWLNVRALLDLNLPAAYWAAAVSQSQPLPIRTHTTSSARLRCLPKHLSAGRTISIQSKPKTPRRKVLFCRTGYPITPPGRALPSLVAGDGDFCRRRENKTNRFGFWAFSVVACRCPELVMVNESRM